MRLHTRAIFPPRIHARPVLASLPLRQPAILTFKKIGTVLSLPTPLTIADAIISLVPENWIRSRLKPTNIPADVGFLDHNLPAWITAIRSNFGLFPVEHFPLNIDLKRMVIDSAKAIIPLLSRSEVAETYRTQVYEYECRQGAMGIGIVTEMPEALMGVILPHLDFAKIIVSTNLNYQLFTRRPYPTVHLRPEFFHRSQRAFKGLPSLAEITFSTTHRDPMAKVVLAVQNELRTHTYTSVTVQIS